MQEESLNNFYIIKNILRQFALEVIQLKCMSFLLVLGLVIISLADCGEAETREKILPDGRTIIVDAAGNIVPDG